MPLKEELQLLRIELRTLRQEVARFKYAWQQQKLRADRFEQENRELQIKLKLLEEENKLLKAKLYSTTAHKDKLAGMIFKTNVGKKDFTDGSKRNRGGQNGHNGYGRKKPKKINQKKEVYLTHCPDCGNKVSQSDNTYERIVEDIPLSQILVTLYYIQRQWCSCCQKELRAAPAGTLEGFRVGINVILWLLFHKYRLRTPLNKMTEALKEQYNLKLTEGAIQNILHQLKKRFGPKYQQIVKKVQNSEVKHADETGWRVEGLNNHQDSKTIQTRIRNQGNNLITALKYNKVPLTNNHAERQIKPMVVTRKISGGSRSPEGAATHAVNMSIVQTVLLEGKSFFSGIRQLLRPKTYQYVLERTE